MSIICALQFYLICLEFNLEKEPTISFREKQFLSCLIYPLDTHRHTVHLNAALGVMGGGQIHQQQLDLQKHSALLDNFF